MTAAQHVSANTRRKCHASTEQQSAGSRSEELRTVAHHAARVDVELLALSSDERKVLQDDGLGCE